MRPRAGGTVPATTIVIPAFRAAATLPRTLASLVGQTDAAWEAIVVDDGSPDDGAAIVARHAAADPRIRLLRQPNRGAAAARNAGLAEARGDLTLFLDADDTIATDYLARMRARFGGDRAAGAVACGYVRRSAGGSLLARCAAPRLDRDPVGLCRQRPPTAMHAILSRTALLRALGGFDTGLVTNEDWDLWWRMARAGTRFAIEPRLLAQYWTMPGSLTHDGAAMLRDTLAMLARTAPPAAAMAQAAFDALMRNGGMAIGGGGDGAALVDLLPQLRLPPDPDRAVAALAEGLVLGSGRRHAELLTIWPEIDPGVTALLDWIDRRAAGPALRPPLARRIEREVIRAARFAGAVVVGRSLGVMLSPRRLFLGICPDAAIDRVVLKVPLVRPRSLLMIETDLGHGVSGARLARLLAARIGAHATALRR